MRIGIQTWGSEGDIRPFVALGAALARRGHGVELLYTEIGDRRYEDVAARSASPRAPLLAGPRGSASANTEIGLDAILKTHESTRTGIDHQQGAARAGAEPLYEAGLDLCSRSDLLIHHFILHPARAAADKAGTPR